MRNRSGSQFGLEDSRRIPISQMILLSKVCETLVTEMMEMTVLEVPTLQTVADLIPQDRATVEAVRA